jgi:Flp pilus assembly protein TadD
LELTPTSAWAFAERGVAYLRSGKPDQAIADLSRSLELDAGDPLALYARGVARKRIGEIVEGDRDIAAAIKLWPNVASAAEQQGIR